MKLVVRTKQQTKDKSYVISNTIDIADPRLVDDIVVKFANDNLKDEYVVGWDLLAA